MHQNESSVSPILLLVKHMKVLTYKQKSDNIICKAKQGLVIARSSNQRYKSKTSDVGNPKIIKNNFIFDTVA